jgi:hypothetical protein
MYNPYSHLVYSAGGAVVFARMKAKSIDSKKYSKICDFYAPIAA